ncbi:MAG: inositol monophosphatase family protein [Gammaproteobacteria bacterium]
MQPILNIAMKAARRAGEIIVRAFDRIELVQATEKHPHDYVTEVDQRSEQAIIEIIQQNYPTHAIIAEESGEHQGSDFTWIIDPLDGTNNFVHGIPHFSVSIAIKHKERLEHGVIYDPLRDELFYTSRGEGVYLNDRRLRVRNNQALEKAIITTGLPFRNHDMLKRYLTEFTEVASAVADMRRLGSAALDLAYVAAGRVDGYFEHALKSWDIAAGILMVKEAGGMVTDTQGGETYLQTGDIAAANPKLLPKLLGLIR